MMRNYRYPYAVLALTLAGSLLVPGAHGASAMHTGKSRLPKTIKIGQITSLTGPFSIYCNEEMQGFRLGLRYATHGTFRVDGSRIQTYQYSDVAGAASLPDPATAVSQATSAIENSHVNILQCCASSARCDLG